jgi:uncharacterized pyridoxamine 5'-phosphate oxidase family protein
LATKNINIIFLSSLEINRDENINVLKKVIEQNNSSFNFYGFSQNHVLEIWFKTKQNVDIVFIDDAYDDIQHSNFISLMQKHFEFFKNTKVVLLSTGHTTMENKELLKKADTFMKKPLNLEKVSKYLLSV